jgi:Holliday junction resolvase
MSAYRRGYAAELRAKRILERRGHVVVRAAGSHGPVDLVGIAKHWTRLVQVKRGRGISRVERTNLMVLKDRLPPYYSLEVWRFVGRGKPMIEVL